MYLMEGGRGGSGKEGGSGEESERWVGMGEEADRGREDK